jgi:hypothetical protein
MATTNAPIEKRIAILGFARLSRTLLYRLVHRVHILKAANIAIDSQKQRNDLTVSLTRYNPCPKRRKT